MVSFSVTRSAQSLVVPSEPTPTGRLALTVIDRVPGLRHMVRSIHVFKHGVEPAKVIKEALSKALVKYYPFAGRFVDPDSPHGEVQLACTGEGAWFVEATANCSLEDVKYLDHPLMIPHENLLPDPMLEMEPLNLPVMMQVTEFTCGGFVLGLISVHTLADGLGAAQFITAVAELARGLHQPSVEPAWCRDLIPSPPRLPLGPPPAFPDHKLQSTTVDIPLEYINHIKVQYLNQMGQRCSTFDISVAKAWQSRTRAIKLDPDADVHLCFFANVRHLLRQVLPEDAGYYGNCFFPVTVTASSERVTTAELIEVVKLIKDSKARLPAEFTKWAAGDLKHDPYQLSFTYDSLFVSDWTRLGFLEVDYGWGPPVHVVPFAYYDFMAVAILGAPPAPKKGSRIMTQCVKEQQLTTLHDEMVNWS